MNRAFVWQQLQRLIDKEFHEAAGLTEQELRHYLPMPKRDGGLLVVSERLLNIQMQCTLLGVKNEIVSGQFNMENHRNVVPVPDTLLYWRYDVEDGAQMLKVSTKDALESFRRTGRLPCTTVEVLAIYRESPAAIDPKKGHYIDAAGSRVKHDDYMTGLGMIEGRDKIVCLLVNNQMENGYNRWGAASCQAE